VKAKTRIPDSPVLPPKGAIPVDLAAMVMVSHVKVLMVLEQVWCMGTRTAASAVSTMEMWAVARTGAAALQLEKPMVM
jgi:hypothetical protein